MFGPPQTGTGRATSRKRPSVGVVIDIPGRAIRLEVDEATLEARRAAMAAKDEGAWKPRQVRTRNVSPALRAYAALTTNAARGAVRDVSKLAGL